MPNTTVNIPAEVNNFYDKTLLLRATPLLVHDRWAQVRDLPQKAGTLTIKFRRYASLPAATTPLQEGVTPIGSSLSVTSITATVEQFGAFVTFSDIVDFTSQDPILTETAELLGENSGDTFDQIIREVLSLGTNVSYGGTAHLSVATQAAGDVITEALIKAAVLTLKQNKARKITKMVNPDTGYATTPIGACYIGIVHPNISFLFKNATNFPSFVPVEKYANKADVLEGEIGKVDEVRFIETTNAKVYDNAGVGSVDVYSTLIFGSDAYGKSRISGKALENIVTPPGGHGDELKQRTSSGWKGTLTAKILNNDFIARIVSTAA
jgi:N4-gp56 family major capsid protein